MRIRTRSRMIVAGVATVAVALVVGLRIGSRRQQRTLSALVDRLIHTAPPPEATTGLGAQGLEALPEPVARYLRLALQTTQYIHEVRISQAGMLRTDVH